MGNSNSSAVSGKDLEQLQAKWNEYEQDKSEEKLNEAIDLGTKLAKKGDPEAQFQLGIKLVILGQEESAKKWFKKASQQNHPPAMHTLGDFYMNGIAGEQNFKKGFEIYRKAALLGSAPSMYLTAINYNHGQGVEKDLNQGFIWYKKAVVEGEKLGQYLIPTLNNLARCYSHGFGTEPNADLAFKYFKEASDLGDGIATYNIAMNFQKGIGKPADLKEAKKWAKKAADIDFAHGYLLLAELYGDGGEGVKRNFTKALICMVYAAYLKHEAAIIDLANQREMPETRIGVELFGTKTRLLLAEMGDPCDEKKIEELETKIKGKLPLDYRVFMKKYNGGVTYYTGVSVAGVIHNGIEHYFDIDEMIQLNPFPGISRNAVVIGEDAGNNVHYMYFKGPKRGKIYFYDADNGSMQKQDVYPPVTNSFLEFVNSVQCLDKVLSYIHPSQYVSTQELITTVPSLPEEQGGIIDEPIETGGIPETGDESSDKDMFAHIQIFDIEDAKQDPELKVKVDELLAHTDKMNEIMQEGSTTDSLTGQSQNLQEPESKKPRTGDEGEKKEEEGEKEKEKEGEKENEKVGDEGEDEDEDGEDDENESEEEEEEEGGEESEGREKDRGGGEKLGVLRLPFGGRVVEGGGYLRTKDYLLADQVLSMMADRPVGPRFRHKNKMMWDYGVYNKITKKGGVKGMFNLVPKDIGSVVWGRLPRISGSERFVQAVAQGTIPNPSQ